MTEQEIKLRKENLERLIENELMLYTRETGQVVDDICMNCVQYSGDDDYFYGIDLEVVG